jgi:O-antigen/teichoic acid export membrane protein
MPDESVLPPEHLMSRTVAARSVSSATFSLAARGITTISGFVRSVLLARMLVPADFGLVGLSLIYVKFIASISTFGLNMALIQRTEIDDRAISTHLVMRMTLRVLSVLLVIALTPLLGRFYPNRQMLPHVTVVLSSIGLIEAANSTQKAVLRHHISFRRLAILNVLSSLAVTIVASSMAWTGCGLWSLVIGIHLVTALVSFVGLWLYKRPWQPRIHFDWPLAKQNLRFGWYVVVTHQLNYVLDQFDDFWSGSALGNTALGFYSKAFEFARYPRRLIAEPLGRVFFSTYSRLQEDRLSLSKSFFRANSLILRVNGLFSLMLFVGVPEFVRLLLGETWVPMISTFRLMIVYCLLDPLILSAGNLLTATGFPQIQTRIKMIQAIIFIPLVVFLAKLFGIEGIAIAADVMLVIGIVGIFQKAYRFVDFSWSRMFLLPLVGLLLSGCVGLLLPVIWKPSSDWTSLIGKPFLSGMIYLLVLGIVEHREYRENIKTLYRLLKSQEVTL